MLHPAFQPSLQKKRWKLASEISRNRSVLFELFLPSSQIYPGGVGVAFPRVAVNKMIDPLWFGDSLIFRLNSGTGHSWEAWFFLT
jgi:hypothetical protein